MESIVYQEKQTTYPIFYAILIIELPLILYFFITGIKQKQYGFTVLITVIFGFLIFVLVNFFHLKIKVYENKIVFYFGIFNKIIYFSEISDVRTQGYNFWKYWGWGIRWNPFDKSRAWVTRSGIGIVIKISEKEYFLSSNNAIQLKDVILQRLLKNKED
jgi:hypothetical protein